MEPSIAFLWPNIEIKAGITNKNSLQYEENTDVNTNESTEIITNGNL